jgi:transcriptional regulator of acetoin/glycerol metabolism
MANEHGKIVRKTALSASDAARSALAASWSRSLVLHGLDPDSVSVPERTDAVTCAHAKEKMGRIAAIASPVMDRLFAAVGTSGCSVVLTDGTGLIVDRRGRLGDDAQFLEWGLWTGADWSEAREGTNGIGTCLVEQRPTTVHRDQHFASRNTVMSCMGAPVFDHEGELAGVLDISSCRADLADAFVALLADAVGDAARRIEAENFQASYAGQRILVGPGDGPAGAMLFAIDQDDLLIGATRRARKAYKLSGDSFRNPKPARDILNEPGSAGADLDAAERAVLRRALAAADGNASRAALALGVSRATLYRRMARVGLR